MLVALLVALGWAAPAVDLEPPSMHTVLYYNARMALREGNPTEATKLWLLRNALEEQTHTVSPHDEDFRSVTWAAMGDLGLCQDGFDLDSDGAGLWPLALHNSLVRNLSRRAFSQRVRSFDALEVGRQARTISISDVLDASELGVVELSRSRCLLPRLVLISIGEDPRLRSLGNRLIAARALRALLERAEATLNPDRVKGRSVIAARLFDLDLQITALAAREARLKARELGQRARQLGLPPSGAEEVRDDAPKTTLDPSSAAAAILRDCVGWSVEEWMALSPERRHYLFGAALAYGGDPSQMERTALGVLDELIAAGDGADATRWIGRIAPVGDAQGAAQIWSGERGARLLNLDEDKGFAERGVIAAFRGVDQLGRGELEEALRSLAFARQHAGESADAATLEGLSLRWLSYVASQFEVTEGLLSTLVELVPRRDYATLLEDLMWSAAFHADARSFETGLASPVGRGALERRLGLLRPLASGDTRRFAAQIGAGLKSSPGETMRFLDQMLERLTVEDAGVRLAQVPALRAVRRLLEPLTAEEGRPGRLAGELIAGTLSIEEGVSGLPPDANARERARALAPGGEVYAGSVRLAPTDPLPWPFQVVEVPAPSVFTPVSLIPVEWRDEQGELVFGWSIRG